MAVGGDEDDIPAASGSPDASLTQDDSFTATSHAGLTYPWGEAAPGAGGGRPLLRAQREVRLYGQVRDTALFLPEPENRTGRRLQEDFRIEWK